MTRIGVNDVFSFLVDDDRLKMSLFLMNFSRDLADFTGDMIVQLNREPVLQLLYCHFVFLIYRAKKISTNSELCGWE